MKDGAQMDYYLDDRPMSPTKVSSCFQCVQNPIRFNSLGQRVSSIQIQYGNIKFILVQEQQQQV
jgi:nucleosome binding factor SPN SPT16 subunit